MSSCSGPTSSAAQSRSTKSDERIDQRQWVLGAGEAGQPEQPRCPYPTEPGRAEPACTPAPRPPIGSPVAGLDLAAVQALVAMIALAAIMAFASAATSRSRSAGPADLVGREVVHQDGDSAPGRPGRSDRLRRTRGQDVVHQPVRLGAQRFGEPAARDLVRHGQGQPQRTRDVETEGTRARRRVRRRSGCHHSARR